MAKYRIEAPVDYISGHLRDGVFTGMIELTDEEAESIKNNPSELR